jgi:hypothetical protein
MPRGMNWVGIACRREPACIVAQRNFEEIVKKITKPSQRSRAMRNRILVIAAVAAVIGTPIAAQAQTEITTGVARGGAAIVGDDADGIAVDQRPAFREYVAREHVPVYTIPDRIVVGAVLPEAGVTYYDVPQTYGVTPYRYTVVNGRTILVEPRSRRIVQVID